MDKKFLVNIYDRSSMKRIRQLIVKAGSAEEACKIGMDWYERVSSRKNKEGGNVR